MSCAFYKRISRKGKTVNGCDVYISGEKKYAGWNLKRSKWAIPIEMEKKPLSERQVLYKKYIFESGLIDDIPELMHQLLGCWCEREDQCHCSVLKELLNDYMKSTIPLSAVSAVTDIPRIQIKRVPLYTARPKKYRAVYQPVRTVRTVSRTVSRTVRTVPPTTELITIHSDIYKDIDLIPYGSIPLSVIIKFPIIMDQVVPPAPPPFNVSEFMESSGHPITKSCIAGLKKGEYSDRGWPDFFCRVAKIVKDAKTSRFALYITDEECTEEQTLKVELGSQLFELAKLRHIKKGDIIHIIDYSITTLAPDVTAIGDETKIKSKSKKKSKIYFVTNLRILTDVTPFPR